MKTLILFFSLMATFSSFADDGINCTQKNNYLAGLTSHYYTAVEFTVNDPFELRDNESAMYMNVGDIIVVKDTVVINPQTIEFKLIDQETRKELPSLIFKSKDIYDSTIFELEKGGLLTVKCDAIAIEDHSSQYARWYAEFKLRKKTDEAPREDLNL